MAFKTETARQEALIRQLRRLNEATHKRQLKALTAGKETLAAGPAPSAVKKTHGHSGGRAEVLLCRRDAVIEGTGGIARGVDKNPEAGEVNDPSKQLGDALIIEGVETGGGSAPKDDKAT
eukprot:14138125-Heterocapsa_arctica.AAC.1